MRIASAAILAASLFAGAPAIAASDSESQGSLAPGGAAGLQQAQDISFPTVVAIAGVIGVAVAVSVLVSSNHSSTATKSAAK
jgi:hypothetical protein